MVQSEQNGVNIYSALVGFLRGKKEKQRQCCVTSTAECCFVRKLPQKRVLLVLSLPTTETRRLFLPHCCTIRC